MTNPKIPDKVQGVANAALVPAMPDTLRFRVSRDELFLERLENAAEALAHLFGGDGETISSPSRQMTFYAAERVSMILAGRERFSGAGVFDKLDRRMQVDRQKHP
jgi:hypothetical protein